MRTSIILGLALIASPAMAIDSCPLPLSHAGPNLGQAKGALDKVKQASDPVTEGSGRVVILSTGDVDQNSAGMRRSVAALLPRADLTFASDVDLNQSGRVKPGANVPLAEQTGSPASSNIAILRAAVDDISSVQAQNMTPQNWEAYAEELRGLLSKAWFIDRPELRAPMFNLYYQIGRAADNAGVFGKPWMQSVDGNNINYYFYLAAALADADPDLLDESVDDEQRNTIQAYLSHLETGRIDRAQIPLGLDDKWDPDTFFATYALVVNGLEIDPDTLPAKARASLRRDGILLVAPGVVDLQLKRRDGGAGMAERYEILSPDDPILPVREEARRALSGVLAKSLSEDLGGCSATPPKGIAPSLAVYVAQHREPVYIAMAADDDPGSPQVWILDPDRFILQKVLGPGGNFPVRFAALMGAGMTINGATLREPTLSQSGRVGRPDVNLGIGYVPIYAHLRGHYKNLMVGIGAEVGVPVGNTFADRHQLPDDLTARSSSGDEVLKSPPFNRLFFVSGGYMHGRRAAEGIGIRGYGRIGWYDVPHTVDFSLHGGLTAEGPVQGEGRIASLIDFNAFFGLMVPFGATVFEKPLVNFGATAGFGTTF